MMELKKINRNKLKVLFVLIALLAVIVGITMMFAKREFFQEMPERKAFGDGYFVFISKEPSFFKNTIISYRYEFNLPGYTSTGYLKNNDSLIFEIANKKCIFPMFNIRMDQRRENNEGKSIPSFDFYNNDEYGNFYYKFIPASFSMLHNVDYVMYKVSFKEGIKGFLIKYDNNEEKIYGEY